MLTVQLGRAVRDCVKRPLDESGNELYNVVPGLQESDLCKGGLFMAYLQR